MVGGRSVRPGRPAAFPHAYQLRRWIRERMPSLDLGGWVNPLRDPAQQVDFLLDPGFEAEFYLTQIVSHHHLEQVEALPRRGPPARRALSGRVRRLHLSERQPEDAGAAGQVLPGAGGGDHSRLRGRAIAGGDLRPHACAALREIGVEKVYVSNLGFERPDTRLPQACSSLL